MNDFDPQMQPRDAYFSKRIRAGKRTYYFDVKATKASDYYITITESKRKPGESEDRPYFEKHKLFLYKEDFEKFADGLHEALDFIRQKRSSDPQEYLGNTSSLNNETHIQSMDEKVQISDELHGNNFTGLEFDDLSK